MSYQHYYSDWRKGSFARFSLFLSELKREQVLDHLAVLRSPDSLFCIPPLHPLRVSLRQLVWHASFQRFINACIAVSSITLALERPGIQAQERFFLDLVNSLLNAVFLIECLLKIVALSFWSYLADTWNRLDLCIVVIAYLDEIVTRIGVDVGTGALKVLRVTRLLRPLRALRNLRALTVLSNALLKAAYPLVVTTCIILMMVTSVAALNMQLMLGAMGRCSDPHVSHRSLCTGLEPSGMPRMWRSRTMTYDWIGAGMLTTFVLALNEAGWIDVVCALSSCVET